MNDIDKDFIALEDMLKAINSGSRLAIERLAHAMEQLRKKQEAEETTLRS